MTGVLCDVTDLGGSMGDGTGDRATVDGGADLLIYLNVNTHEI